MNLAEQIAREHHLAMVVEREGTGPVRLGCSCGLVSTGAERAAHIATVTEQAVRERIEADLGAIQLPDDYEPDGPDAYWDGVLDTHMWWQTKALNIVRGGTP